MTTPDFGKLVSEVLTRMDLTESELTADERRNSYMALQAYKAAVVEAIREAFDEEETPEPVQPTCATCGAPVEREHRFCGACRMPLTREAAAASLEKLFAEEVGRGRYDPLFQEALARVREEEPEKWNALVMKLTPRAKA